MTEREKVIKESEEAIEILSKVDEPTFWLDFVRVAFENALSLLKAQEPVEPLAEYSVHTGSKWAICGKCHEPLAKASDKEMPNYCPFCGRAVKWE